MLKIFLLTLLSLILLSGCGEKEEQGSSAGGMKCGAGKCGANMFDGNSALAKKKKNILSQMRENDSRKDCVISAKSSKAVYNCVREPDGKKLTTKCGSGKCGDSMKSAKPEPAMKCGAGKCGDSMKAKKPEPKPVMKCGAGKCGSM
jgi:uncharacterized low-complexity protein